jgi:hypothetical protein
VAHYRRVWIFVHLEPDNRIVIKEGRRRAQLLDVQFTDIVVQQEHARPAAHATDQHAEVAFPADVPRGR